MPIDREVEWDRQRPVTWQIPKVFEDGSDTRSFLKSLGFNPTEENPVNPSFYRIQPRKGWERHDMDGLIIFESAHWRLGYELPFDNELVTLGVRRLS